MELEFELDNVEHNNNEYSAILVVDAVFVEDYLTGEAWGAAFTHPNHTYEVNSATLFIYGNDGEEIAELNDICPEDYVDGERIYEAVSE